MFSWFRSYFVRVARHSGLVLLVIGKMQQQQQNKLYKSRCLTNSQPTLGTAMRETDSPDCIQHFVLELIVKRCFSLHPGSNGQPNLGKRGRVR